MTGRAQAAVDTAPPAAWTGQDSRTAVLTLAPSVQPDVLRVWLGRAEAELGSTGEAGPTFADEEQTFLKTLRKLATDDR